MYSMDITSYHANKTLIKKRIKILKNFLRKLALVVLLVWKIQKCNAPCWNAESSCKKLHDICHSIVYVSFVSTMLFVHQEVKCIDFFYCWPAHFKYFFVKNSSAEDTLNFLDCTIKIKVVISMELKKYITYAKWTTLLNKN